MRSARDIRACHMLRMMRAAAPAEWNQGLPFPSVAVAPSVAPATAEPEEVSVADWLDSRAAPRFVTAAYDFDIPLPAFVERLAARLEARLDGLAKRISDLLESDNLRRRARSLQQLRLREITRVGLARQAR